MMKFSVFPKRILKQKKAAYFFVIDSIIAGIIIIAGLFFIFGSYSSKPDQESTMRNAEDFLNYIQSTKVREHNSAAINTMVANGNITNSDNTLYLQLLEFFHENQTSTELNEFSYEITRGFIPEERNFEMYINDTLILSRVISQQESARLVISTKRIAYFVINETSMFGPTQFELKVWV